MTLRWTGPIASLTDADRRALFDRTTSGSADIRDRVSSIIASVRRDGDAALRSMASEFDGVSLDSLEVTHEACVKALEELDPSLRRAMERAVGNIRRVHEAFRPVAQEVESEEGIVIGRRPDALGRVGVYAPGGRAAYPSSVLMGVIPARVAGVGEVIVCSPPSRGSNMPSAVVLAAAALAGADRVFALGGAGAVAALAYGTESVPRVDRIVGPGNAYVAEAKIQVSSAVGIDSPAGPSELLVLADESASVEVIVREMMAQAEHDPQAAVVAVVVSESLARRVVAALEEKVQVLRSVQDDIGVQVPPFVAIRSSRAGEIIRAALRGQGAVLTAASVDEAIAFANDYAPEHLLLLADDAILPRLRNAGTIFVGEHASVAFGDYMTGANHVLPTGGLARSYSGLSTLDFVRWTTYQRISRGAAERLAEDVGIFADSEGLPNHAAAARAYMKED